MDSHGEQSSRTLTEQGTFDLAGLPLPLLGDEEGGAWVAMQQLCELLGLEWTEQYEVLRTNPLWSGELMQARVQHAQGENEALCLPLLQVRGWLFALNTGDVKAELREPLAGYQRAITEALDARKQLRKRQLAQHLRDLDALYAEAMHNVEEIELMREECLAAAEVWYGDAFDSETPPEDTPKGSTEG
jgi:hypothetical protein